MRRRAGPARDVGEIVVLDQARPGVAEGSCVDPTEDRPPDWMEREPVWPAIGDEGISRQLISPESFYQKGAIRLSFSH